MSNKLFSIFFNICNLYFMVMCVYHNINLAEMNLAVSFAILGFVVNGYVIKAVVKE